MLMESHNKRWINWPAKEWTNSEGYRRFIPLIEFEDRDFANAFHAEVVPLAETALNVEPCPGLVRSAVQ
jgi:hypothetical protein